MTGDLFYLNSESQNSDAPGTRTPNLVIKSLAINSNLLRRNIPFGMNTRLIDRISNPLIAHRCRRVVANWQLIIVDPGIGWWQNIRYPERHFFWGILFKRNAEQTGLAFWDLGSYMGVNLVESTRRQDHNQVLKSTKNFHARLIIAPVLGRMKHSDFGERTIA